MRLCITIKERSDEFLFESNIDRYLKQGYKVASSGKDKDGWWAIMVKYN